MKRCCPPWKVRSECRSLTKALLRLGPLALAMLLLAIPEPKAGAADAPPVRVRPRTLAEALEQQNLARSADAGLLQCVDASLTSSVANLNAGSLEACNLRLVNLIYRRWLQQLERTTLLPYPDKVDLQFDLYPDGTIREMRATGDQARKIPTLLCQSAVLELSPNLQWPAPMREAWGEGPLHVSLVFYYESPKASASAFTFRQFGDQLHGEVHKFGRPANVIEPSMASERLNPAPTLPWSPGWPDGYDGYDRYGGYYSGYQTLHDLGKSRPNHWAKECSPSVSSPPCPFPTK